MVPYSLQHGAAHVATLSRDIFTAYTFLDRNVGHLKLTFNLIFLMHFVPSI